MLHPENKTPPRSIATHRAGRRLALREDNEYFFSATTREKLTIIFRGREDGDFLTVGAENSADGRRHLTLMALL